jgi:Flp pilus assembly protein CpaB
MENTREAFGRRLKARFGTTHFVAVAAGLLTALLLLSWTLGQEQLISVVFAAEDIRAGTSVEAADLRSVEIPADSSVATVIVPATDADLLVGRVAVRFIEAGEPILRSDLRSVVTEDGRRAMSFAVPPANAVGGDLVVGDQVDVLVVTDEGTRFVAEAVPVLGLPGQGQGGLVGGSSAWWVVLAVEDLDALEIADGVEHGTIYLLRSTGTPKLSIRELTPTDEAIEQPPEAAVRAPGG